MHTLIFFITAVTAQFQKCLSHSFVVFVALTEIAADDDDSPLEKRSRQTLQIT
jgi:hypothetical protein